MTRTDINRMRAMLDAMEAGIEAEENLVTATTQISELTANVEEIQNGLNEYSDAMNNIVTCSTQTSPIVFDHFPMLVHEGGWYTDKNHVTTWQAITTGVCYGLTDTNFFPINGTT